MKTSNNDPTATTSSAQSSDGEHWSELTASLATESVDLLGRWIDEDLKAFEEEHAEFVSANSLKHSLRR